MYPIKLTCLFILYNLLAFPLGKTIKTCQVLDVLPQISPLPFGPKNGLNSNTSTFFYVNLYKDGRVHNKSTNKYYQLPNIKKFNHIKLSDDDTVLCMNRKNFAGFFKKFNKYRYRLPNVAEYECYYMCDYVPDDKEFEINKKNCCHYAASDAYGYLILYNTATKEANLITIYFDMFSGDLNTLDRRFYIDKDYNINIFDVATYDSANIYGKHVISILKNGKILIKKIYHI